MIRNTLDVLTALSLAFVRKPNTEPCFKNT